MEFSSPPPPYEKHPGAPFLEPHSTESEKEALVVNYMLSPESGLDGSAHPALNAQEYGTRLKLENILDHEKKERETDFVELSKEQEVFKQAMKDYIALEHKGSKYQLDLKEDSPMGPWEFIDSVMKSISNAQEKYDKDKTEGGWRRIRNAFRSLGRNNSAFQAWLCLLPQESQYLSILCGGLKLILDASARLSALNGEILHTLCQIPVYLNRSQRLLQINETLAQYSSALFIAIFRALGHILEHYRQNFLKKAGRALLKPREFGKELSEKLSKIEECSKAIDEEAAICHREISKNTNQEVRMLRIEGQELRKQVLELKMFLMANPKTDQNFGRKKEEPSESSQPTNIVKNAARQAKKALLNRLSYDRLQPREDVICNLNSIYDLSEIEQDRVAYIMQSEEFQEFLSADQSTVFLINGRATEISGIRTSFSFICAKFVDALRDARKNTESSRIICLSHFCNEHTDLRRDDMATPAGMLNSLIGQLLKQYKSFDFKKLGKYIETVDCEDFGTLCHLFKKLISQVPEDTMVFCILESLSAYDDEDRGDDADKFLESLLKLTSGGKPNHCIFKLLLTASTQLMLDAAQDVMDDQIMWVPESLDKQGGFTALQWDLSVGQEIEELS